MGQLDLDPTKLVFIDETWASTNMARKRGRCRRGRRLRAAMIRCLVRVMRLGRVLHPTKGWEWLFPADSESGHLVEHKEDRANLAKRGNDLRQTYRTVAQTVGIADLDIHLLMNHSVVGVNAGYINRNKLLRDHLRQQQEMISCKIVDAL